MEAANFLLVGEFLGLALGDFFKVPPEVVVQRFFGLDGKHFNHLGFRKLVQAAILLVSFIESLPRKNR
jgi:hypothetical protein